MADYEFTSYTTDKVMNVLLTMERDVCNALSNCKDIKEGMFKAGIYLGQARLDIYNLLKAEQNKSYDAKEAREAKTYETDKAEKESLIPISVIDKIKAKIETLDFDWGDDLNPTARSASMVCDAIDECLNDR